MVNENNSIYVLKEDWEKKNEQIDEDIKNNTLAINDLKSEIEKSTIYAKQSYEVQKEMGKDVKELAKEMRNQSTDVLNLSNAVKNHDDKIKGIQGTIDEKQKGSVQIIVAIIGVSGVIFTAAAAFLQNIF
ncbi:hypothetical protein [Staphylococcus sp. LKG3-1]|uniref:hypothetical protein n=1 Tax=unclassified Staphylococcus TaxID=91994 RepID=UPI003AFF9438